MVSQPTTSVPAAILKAQSVPPPAVRKSNETFHAVSKKLLSSESSEPRRWQSLKTRGAKLYAWSVAARNDEAAGKKADPRQAALAAAVRMLAYLGGGGETASGSSSSAFDGQRLSSRALREVGIDDIDVPGALASIRKQRNFEEKKAFVKIFHTQKNAAKMTFLSKASAKAAEEFTLVHSSLATDREESPSSSSSAHHQSDDDDSDDEGLVNEEGATPKMERNVKVVVSMFPETKAVRALHEAVGAGDVRRVEEVAKAYGGSSKSEVAAFATMARALHVAAARDGAFDCPSRGVVDCVATNLGADLLAPDALGYTPLHVAAAIGNSAAVSALLKLARRKNLLEKMVSRRCHMGLTPLEVALARRRDMRDLFASILCRARAFDVHFGNGPLGLKLALVRHSSLSKTSHAASVAKKISAQPPPLPPPSSQKQQQPSQQCAPPPPSLVAKKHANRRVRSEDYVEEESPRTLQVTAIAAECPAHELEAGDQLLALNGSVVACPDESAFPNIMAQIKHLPRPLRATFVAGHYPYLSVEDDPVISLLTPVSPVPDTAHLDVLSATTTAASTEETAGSKKKHHHHHEDALDSDD